MICKDGKCVQQPDGTLCYKPHPPFKSGECKNGLCEVNSSKECVNDIQCVTDPPLCGYCDINTFKCVLSPVGSCCSNHAGDAGICQHSSDNRLFCSKKTGWQCCTDADCSPKTCNVVTHTCNT